MKRKLMILAALAVMTLNFSACVVHEHGGGGRHHHHHGHRHGHSTEVIIR